MRGTRKNIVYVLIGTVIFVLYVIMYVPFPPNHGHDPTDETRMNMHVIAAAIEEYRVVEAANGYPALTADNWIPKLAAASESRKIINSLPNNVWSPERKTEFCDAWGNPLVLLPNGGPNGTAQLISAGPDGDITTPDDNVRFHK